MDRDQRPGKIRVVSGGRAPASDVAGATTENGDSAAASPAAEIAPEAPARHSWTGALVFIGGCAAGGAGVVTLLRGF